MLSSQSVYVLRPLHLVGWAAEKPASFKAGVVAFSCSEPHGKFSQQILPLVVFGGLWCLLIKHLSVYWAVDPQYSFEVVWAGDLRLSCVYSLDHSASD